MSCQKYVYKLLYYGIVMLLIFSFNLFLPFFSLTITLCSLYKQLKRPYDEKYPNIVNVENGNLDNCEKLENAVSSQTDDFEGNGILFLEKKIYCHILCTSLILPFVFYRENDKGSYTSSLGAGGCQNPEKSAKIQCP